MLRSSYILESLVWKSKQSPPAKREINASPFFSFFPPILVGIFFNLIRSETLIDQLLLSIDVNSAAPFQWKTDTVKSRKLGGREAQANMEETDGERLL